MEHSTGQRIRGEIGWFRARFSVGGRMAIVTIENLAPGMVLAADVYDMNGRLLIGSGLGLEAKHILIFRTWGIVEADVVGDVNTDTVDMPNDLSPEKFEQTRNLLLPLYAHTDVDHPAMIELLRLATLRKMNHDR